MKPQENTIVDCFTLYTHDELQNMDLSKVKIFESRSINIFKAIEHCKALYHKLMGDDLIPKPENCTSAIISMLATSLNLTFDESEHLLNEQPNLKNTLYEEYFAKKQIFFLIL